MNENWKCPFCGGEEMWFSRSIDLHPDGVTEGMFYYCSKCGRNVDDNPKCVNCGSEYNKNVMIDSFCANCGRSVFKKYE